jgi:hypothetical protein
VQGNHPAAGVGLARGAVSPARAVHGPDVLLDALVADVRRHAAGGVPDGMAMLALLAVTRPASCVP